MAIPWLRPAAYSNPRTQRARSSRACSLAFSALQAASGRATAPGWLRPRDQRWTLGRGHCARDLRSGPALGTCARHLRPAPAPSIALGICAREPVAPAPEPGTCAPVRDRSTSTWAGTGPRCSTFIPASGRRELGYAAPAPRPWPHRRAARRLIDRLGMQLVNPKQRPPGLRSCQAPETLRGDRGHAACTTRGHVRR